MDAPAPRAMLWPVTRIYEVGDPVYMRDWQHLPPMPEPIFETPCHLPVIPKGATLTIGDRWWVVHQTGLAIDEDRGEAVLWYSVEDPKRMYERGGFRRTSAR